MAGYLRSVRPDHLCGLLAEPERLQVFAAIVLGAGTPGAVTELTGLPARTVVAAIGRLEQGGLISSVPGSVPDPVPGSAGMRLVARQSVFKEAVREHAPPAEPAEPLDPDRQRDLVLRTFLVDDRLTRIPAARGKRRIVLEHIVACFEPGIRYPQRAVDAVLRAWHPDYASLRRHLIDEGLMARERGVYWRTGGYVDVREPQ